MSSDRLGSGLQQRSCSSHGPASLQWLAQRLVLSMLLVLQFSCSPAQIPQGFQTDSLWGEHYRTLQFSSGVRVHINLPPLPLPDARSTLVLYALPNGNTIEQTIGKRVTEGVDWHFGIQHIGAQTRQLREVVRGENVIVAYLETEQLSWPQWRRVHANHPRLIHSIVDSIRTLLQALHPSVMLSGHSGGGSFIFGFLNGVPRVPTYVSRISFLDSNYGYDDTEHHGDKLFDWLAGDSSHVLTILAYDDRFITLNGKRVVSDSGGTFRATQRMIARISRDVPLVERHDSVLRCYADERSRQIDIRIHTNPDTLVLHTVLVERNGFIHSQTFGTPFEDMGGTFWGPIMYRRWISY